MFGMAIKQLNCEEEKKLMSSQRDTSFGEFDWGRWNEGREVKIRQNHDFITN